MRTHSAHGFTLVELAISLVVIGLIVGGTLRGREMIRSAQITSTIAQIKSFDAAASTFRDTYGALPGDLKKPALRVPHCDFAPCNIDGNENGKIDFYGSVHAGSDVEPFNFFPHMQKADLIKEPFGGTTIGTLTFPPQKTGSTDHKLFSPKMGLKTIWALYPVFSDPARNTAASYNGQSGMHYYSLFDLSALEAGTIDKKMDNGNGLGGTVLLWLNPAAPSANAGCMDTDGIYLEKALPSVRCVLWVQADF